MLVKRFTGEQVRHVYQMIDSKRRVALYLHGILVLVTPA